MITDRLWAWQGALYADALAMPVHWYYDRAALVRDYGRVDELKAPKHPHPDSILWRSSYTALNERGEILHDQAQYWGQRGIHYHQFLDKGENTLNYQLGKELVCMIQELGHYDLHHWLQRYIRFMRTPGKHRDTYVEEYHREFFTKYARGEKPESCGGEDIHIGGLVAVPALFGVLGTMNLAGVRAIVREHVGFSHGSPGVLKAADAFVRMLFAIGEGQPVREAILASGTDWISRRKLEAWLGEPDLVVIGSRLSAACYIEDAFAASLYMAWKYAGDRSSGITANAMVGGDNCHRAAVVGALLSKS